MTVSILIPAYHAGAFIRTALDSVRAQAHADWEVVVVEDGSHDETEDHVTRFAAGGVQPVRYENFGSNRGVGAVRNRLLELARGHAVAFLDADDRWEPAHLANAVDRLARGADVVISDVRTFDLATGHPLELHVPPSALVANPVLTLFQASVIITSSAVVLSRELCQRVGTFDEVLRIGEDRDYWLRAALQGARFALTGAATCHYAKHLSSSMARTYVVAQHVTRFYEKYRHLDAVPTALRKHLLADSLLCEGRLLRQHNPAYSAGCFLRAWQCEPLNPRTLLHLAFTGWRSVTAPRAA
jgi:glycosyltransferase involved in cell wall biosynthesis